MINVMIVDDSAFMRRAIAKLLEKSNKIKVVDTARDGKEAIEKAGNENIDVITMDVEMPNMDGLEATKKIMQINPKPIVMLSSVTQDGSVATLKALEYGAVDFIPKPSGNISLDIDVMEREIVHKIYAASVSKVSKSKKRHIYNEMPGKKSEKSKQVKVESKKMEGKPEILLIGTSTGGPKALQYIIPRLPKFGVPIIITQHMPAGFTKALAESLNKKTEMVVAEAKDNDVLEKNVVYIAPGGKINTVIKKGFNTATLQLEPNEFGKKIYTPSVDLLFESAAKVYKNIAAVVLTGMGNDGLAGVYAIKKVPCYVMVESESSAIVYGMPKVIVENGLADEVVDLSDFPRQLKKLFDK